ncbi:archease [Mycobacterium celatum]|uniref:archease n=1 Tax=Mycobacterium celatum TaxID=28045 RepID=UPI001E5B39F2|nr:archease [Mycobacterium celatum]
MPHPADVTIEAWGPTREACLAEAVVGLAASFVDLSDATPVDTVTLEMAADDDEDRLVAALDQLIYLVDTQGVVPLRADVDIGAQTFRLTVSVASIERSHRSARRRRRLLFPDWSSGTSATSGAAARRSTCDS